MYCTDTDPRGDLTRPLWERECLALGSPTMGCYGSQMEDWLEAALAAMTHVPIVGTRGANTADGMAVKPA